MKCLITKDENKNPYYLSERQVGEHEGNNARSKGYGEMNDLQITWIEKGVEIIWLTFFLLGRPKA